MVDRYIPSFELTDPFKNKQLNYRLLYEHLKKTGGKVVTRFPPEPNGYLHLGHAKAMFINFKYAEHKNGFCYLRLDDTNPLKETQDYVNSILTDVTWLGHKLFKITFSSDYFDQLIFYAKELIKKNKAYVCQLDRDTLQKERHEGIESMFRNRSTEESLKLFEEMVEGRYKDGEMTLRLKIDMKHNNHNMRDPVAYRIMHIDHYRTQNKYKIYPTYEYSHPIIDSLENITHSLCSMEFIGRNELYKWILDELEIYKPPQIEYSRINISNTILSKRKLIELVNDKIVCGWDDPRMPTIIGLKRKGYTAESINDFCKRVGVHFGMNNSVIDYSLLEECLRQDLDFRAPRVMAVLDPLKVNIINLNEDLKYADVLDFPNFKERSTVHKVGYTNKIYIDRSDFRLIDSPDYFRLAPNKIVRLKYVGLVKCVNYKIVDDNIDEVDVVLLPFEFKPEHRIKGTLNWVSEFDFLKVEIRRYDHLFPFHINDNIDWKSQLNNCSFNKTSGYTDSSIKNANIFDKFQFERIGYFCVDPDSSQDNLILNMTVALKENKNK